MDVITREIERALAAGLYYLAIFSTLSLPDICAALEAPKGTTSGPQYKAWCDTWFLPSYPLLTSQDLYSLRCGVVHQGRLGHPSMQYERILFTVPGAHRTFMHGNISDDALNPDAVTFCRDMCGAVGRWYAAKRDEPSVQKNLPRLVRYHEHGLEPYIVGLPLIA